KEMFFAEAIGVRGESVLERSLPFLATVAGVFSVAYSVRFIADVFFGPPAKDLPRTPHEPPRWMRFPIEVLVLVCLLVGIIPGVIVAPIINAAAGAILGPLMPSYSLAIWHGFTLPLMMSIIALVGGIVLYVLLRRYLATGVEGVPVLRDFQGKRAFERILVFVSWRAGRLVHLLGTERLQPQLQLLFLLAIVAAFVPLRGAALLSGAGSPFEPGTITFA